MKILVHVIPNSNKSKIETEEPWLIHLKGKPLKGEANKELILLLSQRFEIPKSKINIIKGKTSRNKVVQIEVE